MSFDRKFSAFFSEIVKEIKANPKFGERLAEALGIVPKPHAETKRANRRNPAIFDPFVEFERGESILRDRLAGLNIEQLRDIVAQYGMDRAKLAMKWKDSSRLIDYVVTTVAARARKGDAFRAPDNADAEPAP